MSTTFHTAITLGAPANASTFNTPLGQLDAKMGVTLDADGTLKASAVDLPAVLADGVVTATKILDGVVTTAKITDLNVTTGKVADAAITADKLAAAVAGSGLAGGAGTALSVNVDASTIEINTDILRVKDLGVTATKLAATALAGPNIIWDPQNEIYAPGSDFDGKLRWRQSTAITLVNPDASNPTGNPTLRFDPAVSSAAGKHVYLSEASVAVGDVLSLAIRMKGTAAETGRLSARFYDASDVALAAQINGTTTAFTGSAQTLTVTGATVPATAVYVAIFPNRVSGSNTFDVYDWWGTRSDYLPATPTKTANDPAQKAMHTISGIVWDVLNSDRTPGVDFGGRFRWVNDSLLSIVSPDASNIYGGKTLRFAYAASPTFAGKWLYLDEIGAAVGDVLSFNAKVRAASGTGRLSCRFYDVSNVAVGAQVNGPIQTFAGGVSVLTVKTAAVPATAVSIKVYVGRSTGTADIDIYSLSGRLQSPLGVPHPAANPIDWIQEIRDAKAGQATLLAGIIAASATATAFPASQDTYGRHYLRTYQAQMAKVLAAVSGEQCRVGVIGTSHINNNYIVSPFTTWMQTAYGNAGPGWTSFFTGNSDPNGITTVSNAGTWVDSDQNVPTISRGIDFAHVSSTDAASPARRYRSGTFTDVTIHYLKQASGDDFRWRIDAGGWTTVSTANATNLFATEVISGLSNANHTLSVEILTGAGAGCIIMGADFQILGSNGVRVHKIGNSGLTSTNAVAVDATIWQAGIAALNLDLAIIKIMTNDDSADLLPATFATNITTLVSRIRAARALTDIVIISDAANDAAAGTYATSLYNDQLRALMVSLSTAGLDVFMHLPTWADITDRSLNGTGTHYNASGGQFEADLWINRLFRVQ